MGDTYGRHLANTIERSVLGDDAGYALLKNQIFKKSVATITVSK